jgi:hypothetical protein
VVTVRARGGDHHHSPLLSISSSLFSATVDCVLVLVLVLVLEINKFQKYINISMKRQTTPCSSRIRRHCRQSHNRLAFSLHALLLLLVLLSCVVPWTIGSTHGGSLNEKVQHGQQQQPPQPPTPMGVITLNSKNFDASLRDGNTWLIEFYAPW